ncbi:hypothetical protein AK812_SmicGene20027 [Symbiodinium microadriaticum]|uniref:Uncharacterized protein n=1 Tax=Symbiodinium microadriaticum TaxID=2951 RepID=A0A1Q9DR12_SYMMI|nr:hypothetical protein AK812_SmicGene20027 [Symbiodinium microadriaticum]
MNIFFQDMSLPNAAAAQRVEADPTNARFNSGANIWFWKPAVEQANKIFPMLEGRSNLGKEVRQQVEDIKLEISAAVAEAKEAGCKFALSTDSWKSKSETQAFHLDAARKLSGVLTDAEIKDTQLATVMHPFLTCTRMMEGARTPCSLCLVLVHQRKAAMINRGPRYKGFSGIAEAMWESTLWTRPPAFAKAFLAADLDKVCKKHITRLLRTCLPWQHIQTRVSGRTALSMEERAKANQSVAEWAYKTHEAGPELEAHMQEVAAHPDNRRLKHLIQPALPHAVEVVGEAKTEAARGARKAARSRRPAVLSCQSVGHGIDDSTDDFVFGPSFPQLDPDEDKAQADECRASIQHQLDHLDTCRRRPV